MFFIVLLVLVVLIIVFIKLGNTHSEKTTETRYSKTRHYLDFDLGKDTDKIGNPDYPSAGIDSVMKEEFLNDLMDNEKS